MDLQEIQQTEVWSLYEKGRNYHRLMGIYTDTDRNYRMYNGDQWAGAKLGDVEPVQKNFIKPIVKYKVSVIHSNLFAVNYSCENFSNEVFYKEADKFCNMLNRYARRIYEKDKLDFKGRGLTKDAAINDEGVMYVDFDTDLMLPINEVIDKNDIYYGNENDDNIQSQPYILIRKRMPVVNAIELALSMGVSEEETKYIIGDNDNYEESGDAAKYELDNMVTIIYKMYKEKGIVHFSVSSRLVEFVKDKNLGLSLYPVAHFNWEEKKGSARGEGEVRYLIPNQIEVNKTEMRRVLTVKKQAYPKMVADVSKIINKSALDAVGGIIEVKGQTVDDVHKIVGTLPPAQMSVDVVKLQEDLISVTRELAGAGDIASGDVNPENASGRAILAIQQASQAPMTEQTEGYKNFIEDLAKIWLEYLIVHSKDGVNLEEEVVDPNTGQIQVRVVKVEQVTLQQLKASVKIDITPKSPLDKYAQEQTIENLLTAGLFRADRVGELEVYESLLDDDAVSPKLKIKKGIERIRESQKKIADINAQAQYMQQSVNQFLMGDVDSQAGQIADAQALAMSQQAAGQMM